MYRCKPLLTGVLCLALALPAWSPAVATTIRQFPFDELVAESVLIFQGRVAAVRSEEADGLVYTFVSFDLDEVLKGEPPQGPLELRFLGGETAGRRLQVAEQEIPREGEEGFYFVDRLGGQAVNPLLGWSQGHFLIQRDDQGNAIVTGSRQGDEAPALTRFKEAELADKVRGMQFGKSTIDEKLKQAAPLHLSPAYFRETIRLMQEGQDQ